MATTPIKNRKLRKPTEKTEKTSKTEETEKTKKIFLSFLSFLVQVISVFSVFYISRGVVTMDGTSENGKDSLCHEATFYKSDICKLLMCG